jgi:hypothetical protein
MIKKYFLGVNRRWTQINTDEKKGGRADLGHWWRMGVSAEACGFVCFLLPWGCPQMDEARQSILFPNFFGE